jgi:hypothetical protein
VKMKTSQLLRNAAQYLERKSFGPAIGACYAICQVTDDAVDGYDHKKQPMATMVRVYGERFGHWWTPDEHDARIIGLCLAAAIAESEGQ